MHALRKRAAVSVVVCWTLHRGVGASIMLIESNTLRDIEKGYEAKYKLDEERRFKAECRRNKLFGLWIAEHLGLSGDAALGYARSLVRFGLEHPGRDRLLAHVHEELVRKGVNLTEHDLLASIGRCQAISEEQIAKEFPTALDRDHSRIGN